MSNIRELTIDELDIVSGGDGIWPGMHYCYDGTVQGAGPGYTTDSGVCKGDAPGLLLAAGTAGAGGGASGGAHKPA